MNPTVCWMDVSDLLAKTLKEKLKIKVAKCGTPKKYRKHFFFVALYCFLVVKQRTLNTMANHILIHYPKENKLEAPRKF